ncbi:MAG: cupin domain-containing protein [Planctomycetota bacterium]|nr:cupin domain-containing protein [Planctomycetota bacterium]MDA1163866.1 cupin domain-containing protein [Planctomycetota bacterium]
MPIYPHNTLPIHAVPRIRTRVLVSSERGAVETAVWEQWIEADGYIPLHYHEVEEVLVFLNGEVELTICDEVTVVAAPATVIVLSGQIHGLKSVGLQQVHLMAFFPTAAPSIFSPDGSRRPPPWEDLGRAIAR